MKKTQLIQTRKAHKMTQEEVASFLKITTRHYKALEAGTSDGSVKIWQQLAQRFNTTINYLLGQVEEESQRTDCITPDSALAAARLSDVPSEEMILAARDLEDGQADTAEGRRVLELMKQTAGPALRSTPE